MLYKLYTYISNHRHDYATTCILFFLFGREVTCLVKRARLIGTDLCQSNLNATRIELPAFLAGIFVTAHLGRSAVMLHMEHASRKRRMFLTFFTAFPITHIGHDQGAL